MTLLRAFPCDDYQTDTNMTEDGWVLNVASVVTQYTTGGRYGGGNFWVRDHGYYAQQTVVNASDTMFFQAAFKLDSLLGCNYSEWLELRNNSTNDKVAVFRFMGDGALQCLDSNGSQFFMSDPGIIKQNAWQYVQIKAVSSPSAGIIRVIMDGIELCDVSGLDTSVSLTNIDTFRCHSGTESYTDGCRWDDILVLNDVGGAPWNDNVGDRRMTCRLMTADTAQADWSRSGGSNDYEMLTETLPGSHDGDATHIYSNVVGHISEFDFEDLVDPNVDILAVCADIYARKDDSGSRTFRGRINSGGSIGAGSTLTPLTTYQKFQNIWVVDPATSSPFTFAAVNALKMGVEIVS